MRITNIILSLVLILAIAPFASSFTISDVDSPTLTPGQEGNLRISVENTLNRDIEDVSLSLNIAGLPISVVGSSEETHEEIEENDEEDFTFTLRASPTAAPGDYQIPYTLTYENLSRAKTGSIGVRIHGTVEIETSVTTETPVVGEQDRVTVRVINKGFADARYVSVSLIPSSGMTLLSEKSIYIGDVNANDFETATFDVIYNRENPTLQATVEYRDFENVRREITINEPLRVYSQEDAIERGIIAKNNTGIYVGVIVVLIIIWLIVRSIRKRRRMRARMQHTPSG